MKNIYGNEKANAVLDKITSTFGQHKRQKPKQVIFDKNDFEKFYDYYILKEISYQLKYSKLWKHKRRGYNGTCEYDFDNEFSRIIKNSTFKEAMGDLLALKQYKGYKVKGELYEVKWMADCKREVIGKDEEANPD